MSAAFPLYALQAAEQIRLIPMEGRSTRHDEEKQNRMHPKPEMAFYRKYTEAMLRRYARLSLSVGRMPALLGHDAFRGKMSTYRVTSFEDSVIFVYDVEKCLKKLDGFSQELIRRIALQEYTQGEAAGLLRVSLRTIVRRYGEAIDGLTHIFLERRLLNVDPMAESSTTT
ncbi:MAG TPA: hypothetical protein VE195_07940 [Acidobacteriaceae bacterium]|nr:hypothetical protein [Acidobacteriaceae bacterium]